jgi:hypothetical protein
VQFSAFFKATFRFGKKVRSVAHAAWSNACVWSSVVLAPRWFTDPDPYANRYRVLSAGTRRPRIGLALLSDPGGYSALNWPYFRTSPWWVRRPWTILNSTDWLLSSKISSVSLETMLSFLPWYRAS